MKDARIRISFHPMNIYVPWVGMLQPLGKAGSLRGTTIRSSRSFPPRPPDLWVGKLLLVLNINLLTATSLLPCYWQYNECRSQKEIQGISRELSENRTQLARPQSHMPRAGGAPFSWPALHGTHPKHPAGTQMGSSWHAPMRAIPHQTPRAAEFLP